MRSFDNFCRLEKHHMLKICVHLTCWLLALPLIFWKVVPSVEILFGSISSMRAHPVSVICSRYSSRNVLRSNKGFLGSLLLDIIIGLDLMWDSWRRFNVWVVPTGTDKTMLHALHIPKVFNNMPSTFAAQKYCQCLFLVHTASTYLIC